MKHVYLLAFCILTTLLSEAQDSSKIIKLLDGRMQIKIPSIFHSMTAEEYQFKYHKPKDVTEAYSDKNLELNILVSYQQSMPVTEDQLQELVTSMIVQMKTKNPNFKVLGEGEKSINGHVYSFLKFSSQGADQPIFNYHLLGAVNKKLIMFVFNCPEKLTAGWYPKVETMWNSIVQKK